jgi:hypothetical protein
VALDTARWTFERNEGGPSEEEGEWKRERLTMAWPSAAFQTNEACAPCNPVSWAAQHSGKHANLNGGALAVSGEPRRDAAAGLQEA